MPLNDALPPPVAEEELKVFIAISVLAIGVPSSFAKLVAVIIPVALMLLTSNPVECKFCEWNCIPCVCPIVNAVPTFIVSELPLIVVELEPNVTTPTKVACPLLSIVTPLPTCTSLLAVIIPIAE